MPDVSIAVSARNNFSREFQRMASDARAFDKDLELLSREITTLNRKKATIQTDLDGAKKELREAKKGLDGTAESMERLENAHLNVNHLTDELKDVSQAARQAQKDLANADTQVSKSRNSGSLDGGSKSLFSRLGSAGAFQMAGELASEVAGVYISSAYGAQAGTMFGSMVSGAGSGAAIGSMIAPGIGTAIGAGVGALAGAVSGATSIYTERDEAFKGYVQQQTEDQLSQQQESLTGGSSIAARRETDLISFTTLFDKNKELAERYLNDVRALSNSTPFLYDDLTSMSKTLKTYGFQVGNMIPTLTKIGDAGAALGMETTDMNAVATSLGRMYMGGNATREDLDILNDRGINAVQYLADAYGVGYGDMLEKISGGEVLGQRAVEIILEGMEKSFQGAMANQSTTFEGLTSTLQGWNEEMDAAMGAGYNEARKQGMQEQIDWLSGEQGQSIEEANRAIGAWKAELENSKEEFIRDAVKSMMESDDYQTAQAEGDAAKMGEMIMRAKVQGMNEFNESDGAQLALESELALAGAIREDAASNSAYWNAGLRKGEEYQRGLAAALSKPVTVPGPASTYLTGGTTGGQKKGEPASTYLRGGPDPVAFGIDRVPYDDYPALLHEGERVLTANQARQADAGGVSGVTVHVHGMTVREEADVSRVAAALYDELRIAMAARKS
jgi:tape measure domain-containing protein